MGNKNVAKNTEDSDQNVPRWPLISILIPLLAALVIYHQDHGLNPVNHLDYGTSGKQMLVKPIHLLNYAQFQATYPRLKAANTAATALLEQSSRHLMFNADLMSVCSHNFNYFVRRQTYLKRQSPFTSDRTLLERLNVLDQLDSFDLTKIQETLATATCRDDSNCPVSGVGPSSRGPELEKANIMNRWFTRLVNGDTYFDIPDYPLDEQPDKERITHIDSDLRNCVGQIRDQKDCGACYAFSWNSYAEWHYCRQSGTKIDFSEQHIVDCGHLARLNGCIEGYLLDVRDFSHTFGFYLERDYPYEGKKRSCKSSTGDISVKTVDFKRIIVDRKEWEELLYEQPILLEANLPTDIMSYKRGVHPGTNCNKRLAHGMLLVGHGRQEGVPYWLLKNSMGKNWGENGYLRLSRDAPMTECFRTGFISKFKFRDLEDDRYYELYDSFKFEPTVQAEKRSVVEKKDLFGLIKRGTS